MGWLVTRTDLPLKQLFRALVLASFVTPPFVGAFAWTMLAIHLLHHEGLPDAPEESSVRHLHDDLVAILLDECAKLLVDEEAHYLFTTAQQMAAGIYTGGRGPLRPPVRDLGTVIGPEVARFVDDFQQVRAVGSPETVVTELEALVADLEADELIITTYTHDPAHRARSFSLLAEAWGLDGGA